MKQELGKVAIDPETGRDVGAGTFPVSKLGIPVDVAKVRANKTINPEDSVVSPMVFEIPKKKLNEGLSRSDLMVLNIIAANKWKRPIYFTSPYGDLGFGQYLRKDGLSYRLVPIRTEYPAANWVLEGALRQMQLGGTQIRDNNESLMYNNLMEKFGFGGAERKEFILMKRTAVIYLISVQYMRKPQVIWQTTAKKTEALKLLDKVEAGIDPANLPYAMVSRFNSHNQTGLLYLEACL